MVETWKDVAGYEGLYEVSNKGRVKSLSHLRKDGGMHKERILNYGCDTNGYRVVRLCKDGVMKTYKMHRVVALAFIPNPQNKPQINHIDGNKENNYVDNLEWVTANENAKHAWENGLHTRIPYESQIEQAKSQSKLTKEEELFIRTNYQPYSREYGRMALAKRFGVSHSVIWDIINKKRWYEYKIS